MMYSLFRNVGGCHRLMWIVLWSATAHALCVSCSFPLNMTKRRTRRGQCREHIENIRVSDGWRRGEHDDDVMTEKKRIKCLWPMMRRQVLSFDPICLDSTHKLIGVREQPARNMTPCGSGSERFWPVYVFILWERQQVSMDDRKLDFKELEGNVPVCSVLI